MRAPVGPDSSTMDETGPANSPEPGTVDELGGDAGSAPAGERHRRPDPPAATLSGGSAAPPGLPDQRRQDTPRPGQRPSGAFLSHLQSLRELQITLSQEGRPEAIL